MIRTSLLFLCLIFTPLCFEQNSELKALALPSGPAAWWPLDEGKGTSVSDISGGGRTGTVLGAKWKKGDGFWSLWFDGVDDCVVIGPDEKFLPPSDTFTLSAWINPEDPARAGSVAGWTWRNPFGIFIEHTRFRAMVNLEGEGTITDTPPGLAANRWYHVLLSYDGRHIREYVDGRLMKDREFLNIPKLNLAIRKDSKNWPYWNFLIGIGDRSNRFQPFRGKIRDVKVWHRSLTSEEAAGEYQIKAKDTAECRFDRRPLGKVYFCPCKRISLDGPSSQWEGIAAVTLGKENVYNTVSLGIERQEAGPLSWNGPKDLSGQAWFVHDDKNLYVRLKITDDVHVAYPGEGMWKGDSMQIAFDTLNDKSNNYRPDDYEYGFALVQGEVQKVCWAKAKGLEKASGGGLDSIQCRITREADVTCYEFAFPYDSLYPFDPQNGILGFSFIVNDNDGTNRKGWLQLTPGIGDGKNPSAFASLLWIGQEWGFYLDRDKLDHIQATEDIALRLTVGTMKDLGETRVQVNVKSEKQQTVFSRTVHRSIQPGQNIFSWVLKSGTLEPGNYRVEGTVRGALGEEKKSVALAVVSKKNILHELQNRFQKVREAHKTLDQKLSQIETGKKTLPSYSVAAASVVSVFFPLISEALAEKDPEWKKIDLAGVQLKEVEEILSTQTLLADEILSGKQPALIVPSYISGTARVRDGSFVGKVRIGDKIIENYPIIFQGFTLYSRQWQHLALLRKCGFNIVQAEAGIWPVFSAENQINETYAPTLRKFLDDAGEQGVAVDLILSPHYYPEWMAEKYPKLKAQGWFFSDAPENHAFLKKYVDYLVPRLKEGKGLISICLANEPGFPESGARVCPESLAKWSRWLKNKHGTLEVLNGLYGSAYKSFTEVKPPALEAAGAARLDWSWFLQDDFTDWHRLMADCVHQVDPAIPVHTKFLIDWILLEPDRNVVRLPELFSEVTDINGHDEWGTIWASFCSDLQKSAANKPIFNSENHLIADYYEGDVAPNTIRLALWRQVLHGLCASAIWAWDWYNPSDKPGTELFTGNIMYRPACLLAASKAALDMMRLSPEITLLQNRNPEIFLLWSPSDITYHPQITSLILKTYEAAHLLGRSVGFVTERQLENGKNFSGKVIVIPGTVNISGRAFSALKNTCAKNKINLVFVGEGCLTRDEYDRKRLETLNPVLKLNPGLSTREMWKRLYARYNSPELQLEEDGNPAWNIEYRSVRNDQGSFVLLLNHENQLRKIHIKVDGHYPLLFDRMSEAPIENPLSLEPQDVRLIKIEVK
jgi:hypothetical protein